MVRRGHDEIHEQNLQARGPNDMTAAGAGIDTSFARTAGAVRVRAAFRSFVLGPLQWCFAPTHTEGGSNLDGLDGPAVFAAHHESHADTMVITRALDAPRQQRLLVAAAADYFFPTPLVGRFAALVFGAIPVERDRADRRALRQCLELLGEGWSLVIYPEGGRSPAGEIRPFLPGAAWIARRADVPVVPVHLAGTGEVLPKGRTLPRRSPVRVRFGPVLRVGDGESAKEFNQRIEAAVRALADPSAGADGGHPAGDEPTVVPVADRPVG